MPKKPIIPFSPSEADYLQRVAEAEPLPAVADTDPIALFVAWLEEALKKEPNDANAMTLATVDADGMPDARMVLLKGVDEAGFTFFTNFESAKGRQLLAHPKAALVFHWKSLRRQVRVRGDVAPVSDAEADAYWTTRARSAQIGAWASEQSRELPDRLALERRIAEMGVRFGLGEAAAPAALVGLPADPEPHRVLARPPLPPARAPGLRPRRRRLDGEEAVSLSASADVHAWLAAQSDRVIETSCAWVFLQGERALKVKKPVNYGFLDFSTPEKRRWALERELAFNRTTAPDIYRAVRRITGADGGLALDGDGEAIDFALEMRAFDPAAVLSEQPERVDGALAEALGRTIARFHAAAEVRPEGGGVKALGFTIRTNADNLRHLAGELGKHEVEHVIAATDAGAVRSHPAAGAPARRGFRAALPRRPASGQHPLGGRQAGPLRLHRVQRPALGDRRPLRRRVPGHGPLVPRSAARRPTAC